MKMHIPRAKIITKATIRRHCEAMNLSRAILSLHRTLAARARREGNLSGWAKHMNHCRIAKGVLSRDAKAVHSLLYCDNRTNVKP